MAMRRTQSGVGRHSLRRVETLHPRDMPPNRLMHFLPAQGAGSVTTGSMWKEADSFEEGPGLYRLLLNVRKTLMSSVTAQASV